MFPPTEFVSSPHLQREPRADLDLCRQKFRSIPVVLHLFLDLLSKGQLFVLLLRGLLFFLGHSYPTSTGLFRTSIFLHSNRLLIIVRVIDLLADSRRRRFILLDGFLGLFRIEARGRERLRRGRVGWRRIGRITAILRDQDGQRLHMGRESRAVQPEACGGSSTQCASDARTSYS